ncbi:MAG: hypothetical protein ACYC26_07545 [Phycisphaerales bacterium]
MHPYRTTWIMVFLCLFAPAVVAQMTPEEAQKKLHSQEKSDGPVTSGPDAFNVEVTRWNQTAIRAGSYFCKVGERYYANVNYDPRVTRDRQPMPVGNVRENARSFKVLVGYINIPQVSDPTIRKPVTFEIEHKLPTDEMFARRKAIGLPMIDEFGYVSQAVVKQIIDDQTVLLDKVVLLSQHDYAREYEDDKAKSYMQDPRYDLQGMIRQRVHVTRPSWFEQTLPTALELTTERTKLIDWEYEGRMSVIQTQNHWDTVQLKITGISTSAMTVGRVWDGRNTQLALVEREGNTVTAVPTVLLARPMPRDQMIELLQSHGYDPQKTAEMVRLFNTHKVPGQSTERRIALLLAGRPLEKDPEILANPGAIADVSEPGLLPGGAPTPAPGTAPAPEADNNPPPPAPAPAPSAHAKSIDQTLSIMLERFPAVAQRPVRDSAADAGGQWWRQQFAGKDMVFAGKFVGAGRIAEGTPLTNALKVSSDSTIANFRMEPVPVGETSCPVRVRALFGAGMLMKLMDLPTAMDDGQATPPVSVRGKLADVHVNADGSMDVYLTECLLEQ